MRDLGIGTDDLKQGRYAGITAARSVAGPVIVIFSKLDSANGSWYPLGARISRVRPPIQWIDNGGRQAFTEA